MTVGFHAPLPPSPTGVADYAAALLAELRRHGRVVTTGARADVQLYHLGNNPLHAGIYRRALEAPGVAVLHDAVLHHFLLGTLARPAYIDEFAHNYGEWNRELAAALWSSRAASASDPRYFDYPMLRRVAERSLAVVVHNPAAARIVRAHAPEARIVEIPHLALGGEAPGAGEAMRFRQRAGLDPADFVFGIFGYLRESKRVLAALEAFAEVRRAVPRTALLLAGRFVSGSLERGVERLGTLPGVVRLPYLEERDFSLAAAAVDACINLRHPAAGETSGITIRLMAAGKPVLVTETEENARYPEGGCIRIPPGPAERASLAAHMLLLTSSVDVARAIGQRGAGHILEHHRVEDAGKRYWDLLCEYSA
jgi:glycosyltransferase involved in cell wall biosynthesis